MGERAKVASLKRAVTVAVAAGGAAEVAGMRAPEEAVVAAIIRHTLLRALHDENDRLTFV